MGGFGSLIAFGISPASWIEPESLSDWNWRRRALTNLAHWLTRTVLGLPQDATSAFRCYQLDRIPRELFDGLDSNGYDFFFESLFALRAFKIKEVPVVLPARTCGNSKMTTGNMLTGVWRLFAIGIRRTLLPVSKFLS
jgi:dolichol-phosphate mannosyltransferase